MARTLLSQGHRVRVLDNLLYGAEPLHDLYGEDGFEFIRGDVRSTETFRSALEGADAVVHLAAIVGDPACSKQPTLALEVNQEASLAVFQASQEVGVPRFVFASTCSNYGKMPEASSNLTEEAELAPVSLYAKTKVFAERALLSGTVENSVSVTVVRFATLYGISPRMRFDLTVNEFTAQMFLRRKLILYGEQFWRPYVHVDDAVARGLDRVEGVLSRGVVAVDADAGERGVATDVLTLQCCGQLAE